MHYDRLSALMNRFELTVQTSDFDTANFYITYCILTQKTKRVILTPHVTVKPLLSPNETLKFTAKVAWGGNTNPLLNALPKIFEQDVSFDVETACIANLIAKENDKSRCGGATILARLSEILMIRMIRREIEKDDIKVGLIGGLSDVRLSRAIVMMHDQPAKKWKNEELASIAGLSLSRFCELFAQIVQQTPIAYLRSWRLTLARQELLKGARVQDIAQQFGYLSGEALSRSFHKQYGLTPSEFKKAGKML